MNSVPGERLSFDKLKDCLTIAPVLRVFDSGRCSVLTTDASEMAVSAVLTEPDNEGVHHLIVYESCKLRAFLSHPRFGAACRDTRLQCLYSATSCSAAGRLSLMAFARTLFSALTIRRSHGSEPNGTAIDSSPLGWTKSKNFAVMSSTYQETSIQPTLSIGAALSGSESWPSGLW
jgi:hypothetical protein